MEAGGGSACRRRLSDGNRDAMSGLTLAAVLGNAKLPAAPVQVSRTLLDIIRDEEPNAGPYKDLINHHNKKSWKSFKDRLRLRRAGAAWTSTVHIPTSDVSIQNRRSQLSRHHSSRIQSMAPVVNSSESTQDMTQLGELSSVTETVPGCDSQTCSCPRISRQCSSPFSSESTQFDDSSAVADTNAPASDVPVLQNSRSQMLRLNTFRIPSYSSDSTPSMTRSDGSFIAGENIGSNEFDSVPSLRLSAALAAEREEQQRAAALSEEPSSPEAENRVAEVVVEELAVPQTEEAPAAAPVRMSLMDLLEETDRQMGWYSYAAEVEEEDEEEKGEDDNDGDEKGGGREYNCCVCMLRHKGAAFIPCGHTFCRLCSRELWVSRGNCPLCNGFILEILDIF